MAVSGAATGPPSDGTPLNAPASLRSPFEAVSDGFDPFDCMQLHCGTPHSHPGQSRPADSDSQTPLPAPVHLIETMSGPSSSHLRPDTPSRSGPFGSRQRLVRRLSRTGSSQGSAGDTPGDTSSPRTGHAEHTAAEPRRAAMRAGGIGRSRRRAPGSAAGGGVTDCKEPSLRRRLQNREAQQRRRQRLKVRNATHARLQLMPRSPGIPPADVEALTGSWQLPPPSCQRCDTDCGPLAGV